MTDKQRAARIRKIAKAYGVGTFVLSDVSAVYCVWNYHAGRGEQHRVPQHYISSEHPQAFMLTPAALGLSEPLPNVVTIC